MQIITFAAIKGGVGKTTITYNLGEWLVQKRNEKVLLIDADSQSSLSQTYQLYNMNVSLADVLSKQKAANIKDRIAAEDVIKHTDTVDIVPSSLDLDTVIPPLDAQINNEFMLYMWLDDNFEYLKQYDYVLIDCHPDFSIITQNAIIPSDLVLSPIEPSRYSLNAKTVISERFDQLKTHLVEPRAVNGKRQSYVKAGLYFIGNRIKPDQTASKEFLDIMQRDQDTIAYIPENHLLNESTLFSTPVFAMKGLTDEEEQFRDDLAKTFGRMLEFCQKERT